MKVLWNHSGLLSFPKATKLPEGKQACHRCDNPLCVNPGHMFSGTIADNMHDRGLKGRTARGEKHGNTKLTRELAGEIRRAYASGLTQQQVALKFGIPNHSQVSRIVNYRAWF